MPTISQLPLAASVDLDDILAVVQDVDGVTRGASLGTLSLIIGGGGGGGGLGYTPVNRAGDTFSGSPIFAGDHTYSGTVGFTGGTINVGANAASAPVVMINGSASGTRALRFNAAGVNRFAFITDTSNNFLIRPYPDAGSGTNGDTTITRSTGAWTFGTTISVAGLATALGYRATGATFNYTTATPAPITRLISNYTGVYNGTGGSTAHLFEISSDAADTTANSGAALTLDVTHQFSGSKGAKGGIRSFLVQSGATDSGAANPQHVAIEAWTQVAFNAGGTNITNAMNGAAYAFNPQVLLLAGATNWFTANPVETNVAVVASTRTVTVGGTVTAGNVATVTFTSTGISGSPVAVTYTTGTAQDNRAIANGIVGAINSNSALREAGIAAQRTSGLAVVNLYWPGELTVTPSVGMSGGATTTLTLGSFVQGASVAVKNMNTFIRLNGDTGTGGRSEAIVITGQGFAPASGQFDSGIQFGTPDGAWSIKPSGALFKVNTPQSAAGSQGRAVTFPVQAVKYGLDLRYLNVTQATGWIYQSAGFADRGNGVVEIKSAVMTADDDGFALDVTGLVATSAAVSAGGGGGSGSAADNYAKGDIIFDDYGGQYLVSTVNPATGAVTGITMLVAPHVRSGSAPSNPLATVGGSGVGLTLTITWPSIATLSLQPSGGATTIGGSLAVGSGPTRWISGSDGTAESGGNVGTNWSLDAYNDAGAYLSTPLFITRSTGRLKLMALTNAANDAAASGAGVAINELYRNGSIVMQRVS